MNEQSKHKIEARFELPKKTYNNLLLDHKYW